MTNRQYFQIASSVFAVIAVVHAARSVYGWEAVIAGVEIPVWISWFAMALAGYLAYRGFSFLRTRS